MDNAVLSVKYRALTLALMLLACVLSPRSVSANSSTQIPETYQMAAENDLFELHIDHATLAFKLLDKRSGYVWHSGIDELQEEDRLNRSWQAFAQSGLSIEYLDSKAISKRISLSNTEHLLEITAVESGISAQVTFPEYGISLAVRLLLDVDGIRVDPVGFRYGTH